MTPKPGSDLRSDILAGLRTTVEARLNKGIEDIYRHRVRFLVRKLRVRGAWAFVIAQPIERSGRIVNWRRTAYARAVRKGIGGAKFEERVVGLLQKVGRRTWQTRNVNIGMRGQIWWDWAKRYGAPPAIF